MKQNLTPDERDDEIVPFIGIPRKWTNPAVKLYALLFLGYSGWISYQSLSETADPLVDRLAGLWTHLAASGFVEGLLLVSLVHIGDIFMYLTRKFMTDVAKIRAEGVEEGRAEGLEQGLEQGIEQGLEQGIEQGLEQGIEQGLEQGIEQGLEQGIATAYRQWQAWNTRRMEAEAKGEPFREPPPTPPQNGDPPD